MSNNIPPGKSAPWEGEDKADVENPAPQDMPVHQDDQDGSDESDIDPFAPPVGGVAE